MIHINNVKLATLFVALAVILGVVVLELINSDKNNKRFLPQPGSIYTYNYPSTELTIDIQFRSIDSSEAEEELVGKVEESESFLQGIATFESGGEVPFVSAEGADLTILRLVTNNRNQIELQKPLNEGKTWTVTSLDAALSSSLTETYEVLDIIENYRAPFGTLDHVYKIKRSYDHEEIETDYFYIAEEIGLIKWEQNSLEKRIKYKELIKLEKNS
ncbi:hypothetical protein LGQ02_18285 [Bacillus shivajii]|uniref:hypothetical protein n=1 Tax=Bacillus shivajii TaxID=1983719 RepID=UPI001CFB928C|nr:hypothetical protein [Bacillus shivajii]UCZ52709.1 hypothetical protein LGQ02_18285 [Bacillus shivajii]